MYKPLTTLTKRRPIKINGTKEIPIDSVPIEKDTKNNFILIKTTL